MQIDIPRNEDVAQLIADSKNIGIIPSFNTGFDAFCAAVSLYHMLKDAGKNASFIYPQPLADSVKDLITQENVISNLLQRDLVVTVDYNGTGADKVKYNTENSVLTFRIGPIASDFNTDERVKAKIASYDFDLCFVVGADYLEDLGDTYTNLKTEIHASKIVNVDNSKKNSRFGIINIIDPEAESLSLIIFQKATEWKLTPGKNAAKAMLKGMTAAMQS